MTQTDKNIFTKRALVRMIDLGWNMKTLASKLGRPRESVSRSIHSKRFPLLRQQVAKKLNIELDAA